MSTSAPEAPQAQQAPPAPEPAPRVLRRSRDDKMVAGVCGGLAHYLGVDPVLIRLAAVALALSGGVGILLYVVAAIILPAEGGEPSGRPGTQRSGSGGMLAGIILVLVGGFLLLRQVTPWPDASIGWPAVVVAVGVVILVSARRQP